MKKRFGRMTVLLTCAVMAVLINFWATWCVPCQREFPFLTEAYEQYGDRVAFIALSA